MNLNKDASSWARVVPKSVIAGSTAQAENVLTMALFDIQKLDAENKRLRKALYQIAAGHGCTKPQLREAAQDALNE